MGEYEYEEAGNGIRNAGGTCAVNERYNIIPLKLGGY